MSIKSKSIKFILDAQLALQKIQDNCRRNQRPQTYQPSYKPLLLQTSESYRKNSRKNMLIRYNNKNNSRPKTQQTCKSNNTIYLDNLYIKSRTKITNRPKSVRNQRQYTFLTHTNNSLNTSFDVYNNSSNKFYTPSKNSHTQSIFKNKISNSPHTTVYLGQNYHDLQIDIQKMQFLQQLYISKTKDLKILSNQKQKKIFIQKLKNNINQLQFNVSQCDFGLNSIITIIQYLKKPKNINIQKIILDKNPINDQGLIKLLQIIPKLQKLQQLSLVSINISHKYGRNLLNSIKGHPTLQILNISSLEGLNRNRINSQSYIQIKQIFIHPLCKLHSIYFNNTNMGEFGFIKFCLAFANNSNSGRSNNNNNNNNSNSNNNNKNSIPTLNFKQINLSNNQITVSQQNIPLIRSSLANLSVQKLHLQNNNFNDIGIKIFSFLIGLQYGRNTLSTNLTYLNVSNNNIKSHGFQSICSTFGNNKKLLNLYLNKNNLSQNGVFSYIRNLISHTSTIKILQLKSTLYNSPQNSQFHLKHLSQSLSINKSLKQLDLSDNIINTNAFISIFKQLQDNKVLKILKLQKCGINDQCIEKAQKYMKINQILYNINMNNNYINDNGANILLNIITQNKRIGQLLLKKNCINIKILQDIEKQLYQNRINVIMHINDDPQYKYIQYAEKMQIQQKNKIIKEINKLEIQNNKALGRNLAIDIIEIKDSIVNKEKQMQNQAKIVEKLEKQLQKMMFMKKRKRLHKDSKIQDHKKDKLKEDTFLVTST